VAEGEGLRPRPALASRTRTKVSLPGRTVAALIIGAFERTGQHDLAELTPRPQPLPAGACVIGATMNGNAWALRAVWCRVVVLFPLALGSMVLPALAEHGDHWSSTPYRLLPDSSLRGPPDEDVVGGDDEPAPSVRDWVGLGRDTAFLIGYQILGAAILYALPESASRWSDSHKEIDAGKWWENVFAATRTGGRSTTSAIRTSAPLTTSARASAASIPSNRFCTRPWRPQSTNSASRRSSSRRRIRI
jgi:hypothetical protein